MGPWSHLLKKSLMESFIFCFNFQFFFIIHNENPKNTNSAVIQKRHIYYYATISLVKNLSKKNK